MTPTERGAIYDEMNRVIAALHRIDPAAVGLADYGKPGHYIERQVARWTRQYRAAETERIEAADALIEDFDRAADRTGADNDATHFQASVVQFTDSTMRVFGVDNFAGSVLADVGVDRPVAQRFTDKPYIEIGISDEDLGDSPDFSAAEGDIVYVSFATAAARERASKVMDGDAWKKLSATRDDRVFAVNNEVWQTGEGIIAARGILADLRWLNSPIN